MLFLKMGLYFAYTIQTLHQNIKLHCLVLYQEDGAFEYKATS